MANKIYYWKSTNMLMYFQMNKFDGQDKIFLPEEFKEFYKELPIELEEDKEEIFHDLNVEGNPMGTFENQEWIKENGLHHTSMSVGDMVKEGDKWYVCLSMGWAEVSWIKDG